MAKARGATPRRPFFKFLEPQYAESMVERGNVRIGTLHEYTDEERYSGGTLDKREGTKRVSILHKNSLGLSNRVLEQNAQDCHIYCTTEKLTVENVRRNYDEGRAQCVAILDSKLFQESLVARAEEEGRLATFRGNFPCRYEGRNYELSLLGDQALSQKEIEEIVGLHPGMLKEPSHSWQKEYRMVWDDEKRSGRLEPVIFHRVAGADRACVPLNVDKRISNPERELPEGSNIRLTSTWKNGDWTSVEYPAEYGLMRPIVVAEEGQWYVCACDEHDCKIRTEGYTDSRERTGEPYEPLGGVIKATDPSAELADGAKHYELGPLNRIKSIGYSIA